MRELFTKKELKALIIPLVIEQILAMTVGIADTMMISSAGEAAISGVSLVDMINNLLIGIFAAISTGGAVIISQYLGSRSRKKSCEAAGQLILITALISVGIMALALIFREHMLRLLFGSIDEDVMGNAITYLILSAYSYPFLAVYNSGAAIYRSMGNSKVPMYISAGMNIINIIGNAVLIFGFHMGVTGAALSTLAARAIAGCVQTALVCSRKNQVFIQKNTVFHWNSGMIKKILGIALPNGVESGIFQGGRVVVVSIIAGFGTAQIAANAVANSLDALGVLGGNAMNLAMITVIGQCIGAGDSDQAAAYTKRLMKITYGIIGLTCGAILIFLNPILNFYSLSAEARQCSITLVALHDGFAILLWPVAFTLSYALRAAGDVKCTMIISVVSMLLFRIVFSIILGIGFGMGAVGVWIAMIIDWVFRSAFFILRYRKGKWRRMQVI
ncbi:MAG: MATE family efflux transporter [Lachnospiraceae bacterium]|nr:MATE family efflux transporter [Lachnospiraceae bacterium]MDD3794374.1 MATE family efflux transporter [Lachnospiraceae bacterium]